MPTSLKPNESPINGHEQNLPNLNDLQFACTYPLATPKTCAPGDTTCDCSASSSGDLSSVTVQNSPLCQPPSGGAPTNVQSYAKAYPGVRELQVLKDFGANAIVASACPKLSASASAAADPSYGYNPAMTAIIDSLKESLRESCLPRAIATNPTTHQIACHVIEAQQSGCDCTLPGRSPADSALAPAVERQLQTIGLCDSVGQPSCTTFCECEIVQESGTDLAACSAGATAPPGFCYIDDPSSPALSTCPKNQQQRLRFVDSDPAHPTPAPGSSTFIACLGASLTQ